MIKPQAPDLHSGETRLITQEELPNIMEKALNGEEIYALHFKKIDFKEAFMEKVDWKGCTFEGCKFQNVKANGSYFTDISFLSCDFSGASLNDSVFSKVRFQGCKLTGTNLFACGLRDVLFLEIVGDYAVFTKSRIKGLLFQDCKLPYASLDELTGRSFAFEGCELHAVNFYKTLLHDIDLTDCNITGAMFTERELRGAKVTSIQACELAKLLGVVIVD